MVYLNLFICVRCVCAAKCVMYFYPTIFHSWFVSTSRVREQRPLEGLFSVYSSVHTLLAHLLNLKLPLQRKACKHVYRKLDDLSALSLISRSSHTYTILMLVHTGSHVFQNKEGSRLDLPTHSCIFFPQCVGQRVTGGHTNTNIHFSTLTLLSFLFNSHLWEGQWASPGM